MVIKYLGWLNCLWISSLLLGVRCDPTPDEQKFVETYGNIGNVSGRWEYASKNYMNDEKLLDICTQAHGRSGKSGEVGFATYTTRKLEFTETFETVEVDIIFYVLSGIEHKDNQSSFYITKGLGPDCVFYLKRMDETSRLHRLEQHVCDLKVE